MKKAGITSFKIEGRNRDPRYVDTVVRAYRKAIDNKLTKTEIKELIEELKSVYNREFSSGFYLGLPTSDDFATIEHSAAKKKKEFVGKIIHYFKDAEVATIKLVKNVKVGDELAIIGNTTGIENVTIDSMEMKRKPIKKAKAKQEIGIKLPLCRKNDEVYLIKKTK